MKYLIIGNCAAGVNAIEGIREIDDKGEITLISDENYPAYCRCLITNYVIGTHKEKDILLTEENFYKKNKVNLLLGKKVKQVNTKKSTVVLGDGKTLTFDKLLIATGASPAKLSIKGEDKKGVSGFRTLNDAKDILKRCKKGAKVFVFGGGLIGLKAGYALKKRDMDVEIIVKSKHVLSQVVDEEAALLIGKWFEENGIKTTPGLGPEEILGGKEVEEVLLDNKEKKKAQIVIIGKGVRANMDLVKDTPIKTEWGILTDDYLQTNEKNIFAAGDVAQTKDLATGESVTNALWIAATEQGKLAGKNMAGEKIKYPGSIGANSAEFFGLPFISMGKVRKTEELTNLITRKPEEYLYKKLVIKDNRLIGAVLVGNIENAGVYMALIRKKVDISEIADILLEDYFDYSKVANFLESEEGFRETLTPEGRVIKVA
jgi:nitrite reductase (NADH) large subunit